MLFDRLKRRHFITVLGGAVAWPLAVKAQQDTRIARVGVLGPAIDTVPAVQTAYPFFLAELRKLGFETGRNVLVEYRASGQSLPQATVAVNELVVHHSKFYCSTSEMGQNPNPNIVGSQIFGRLESGMWGTLSELRSEL